MNGHQQGSPRGKPSSLREPSVLLRAPSNPRSGPATAGKMAHTVRVVWVAVKTQLAHTSNPAMLLYLLFTKKFRQKK